MRRNENATCQSENVTFPRKTLRGNLRQNFSAAELIFVAIATKVISESSIDTNHCFRGEGVQGRDTTRQEASLKKVQNETICFSRHKTAMISDHWIEVTTIFKGEEGKVGLEGGHHVHPGTKPQRYEILTKGSKQTLIGKEVLSV